MSTNNKRDYNTQLKYTDLKALKTVEENTAANVHVDVINALLAANPRELINTKKNKFSINKLFTLFFVNPKTYYRSCYRRYPTLNPKNKKGVADLKKEVGN